MLRLVGCGHDASLAYTAERDALVDFYVDFYIDNAVLQGAFSPARPFCRFRNCRRSVLSALNGFGFAYGSREAYS